MLVRHGVMLVGPTGGGKTTCYRVLAEALSLLEHRVKCHVLNPKALSINELYGVFDELSHEWTDGLVAQLVRAIITNKEPATAGAALSSLSPLSSLSCPLSPVLSLFSLLSTHSPLS